MKFAASILVHVTIEARDIDHAITQANGCLLVDVSHCHSVDLENVQVQDVKELNSANSK
jgi:hypothetical protein